MPTQVMPTGYYNGSGPLQPQAPAPAGPGHGGGFVNTAAFDPTLMSHINRINKRLDSPDVTTGRAIDVAGGRIRDLGEGITKQMRAGKSRAGSLAGTSAPGMLERDIQAGVASDVAGAATDITLQRARDDDSFLLSATGAMAMPGQNARADRAQSFNEYMGHNQLGLQAQAQRIQQMLAVYQLAQQSL